MTQFSVSIVIPAYQEEDQIRDTLYSLRNLKMTPVEVIVVDDGSVDRTVEFAAASLEMFENGRLLRNSKNLGKAAALNFGIAHTVGDLVLTLDADTRLESNSLGIAAQLMENTPAEAIALDLRVEQPINLLGRIQSQEYRASMNFERSGQSVVGSISILPGAATLFRREALLASPFSDRTQTEDADQTLSFSMKRHSMVLESHATAFTAAPVEIGLLLQQRIRWAIGHFQCCWWHKQSLRFKNTGAMLTFLNFVLGAFSPFLVSFAILVLVFNGPGPLIEFEWFEMVLVSTTVIYLQRAFSLAVGQCGSRSLLVFFLEPLFSGAVGFIASIGAGLKLMVDKLTFDKGSPPLDGSEQN